MLASALPPEVGRGLDLLGEQAPGPASRARAVIEKLFETILNTSWPEVVSQYSTLTGDGFPFEFSFSSGDEEIRYAAEFAPPEASERDRVDLAAAFLSRLGSPVPDGGIIRHWRKVQSTGRLRFGAFIGGRHAANSDIFKVYIEVPEGCPLSLITSFIDLPGTPVMLGFYPHDRRTEVYFRGDRLSLAELTAIASRVGLDQRCPELLELIESVWQRPIRNTLPGSEIGFSLSNSPDGNNVFAVFNYASSLLGTDRTIRSRILTLAGARRWSFSCYELLTRNFDRFQPKTLAHTMLTYAVSDGAPPSFHVGVRPVA